MLVIQGLFSQELVKNNHQNSFSKFFISKKKKGGVVPLSIDQRPSRKCEKKRLEDNNILINQNYVESNGYLLSISRFVLKIKRFFKLDFTY